jgi:nucleoside-diphosphate-sugar epimerase
MDASNDLLRTAIVCPPDIYGQSTGTGNRSTFLVPEYLKVVMRERVPFYLGEGQNRRAVSHVGDVVELFMLLIEAAVTGNPKAQWGKEGFYFAVVDEVQWRDVAIAVYALGIKGGWLKLEDKPVAWSEEQVAGTMSVENPFGRLFPLYFWGSNSRAHSRRARELGWVPKGPTFWQALPGDVEVEVRKMRGEA